ncbi:MAG: hypothetical protein STSR0004_16270 [Peptococcaceae bacterium]
MARHLTAEQSLDFNAFGIAEGMQVKVSYKNKQVYPNYFIGVVEAVYNRFAVIKTGTYRTTIHIGDITGGLAKVEPAVREIKSK